MKIAVVSTGLDHVKRGVESWAATMARALAARACDVTLFKGSGALQHPYEQVVACLPRNAPANGRLLAVTSRLGGWRYGLGSDYKIEQASGAMSLLWALRRTCFDIVHTQDAFLAWLLQRAGALGWHRARVIFANGTAEPSEVLARMQYVQELSPAFFSEHAAVRNERQLFLVPNSVDVNRFSPGDKAQARRQRGLPADALVVLSVGAIKGPRKRMDWLIQEFEKLNVPGSRLVIAGAVERETEALIRWGRSLLGDRLVILADRDHHEMPDIYRTADAFVLCAVDEVFGIAFLEAMASGVPCLGHEYPVTKWIIGDGGVTLDMTRPGELSRALQRLSDGERLKEMGQKARQRACDAFSDEVVVEETLKMYRRVVQEGRPQ